MCYAVDQCSQCDLNGICIKCINNYVLSNGKCICSFIDNCIFILKKKKLINLYIKK